MRRGVVWGGLTTLQLERERHEYKDWVGGERTDLGQCPELVAVAGELGDRLCLAGNLHSETGQGW